MSIFDIGASQERARRRLQSAPKVGRRPRSDRGRLRIDPRVLAVLVDATASYDRPSMAEILKRVGERCRPKRLTPPSRASVYKLLGTLPTPSYRFAELPAAVQNALYNLGPDSDVPAHQIAFYCFNYGDVEAMSFAAGLPWLALYQALRTPGHRPKSRGLLEAVAVARGL